MSAKNNKIEDNDQIIDEAQDLTIDILKCYNKIDYKGMNRIMAQATPKVKEEIIIYIDQHITYVKGWHDDDTDKKRRLFNLRLVKMIVQKKTLGNILEYLSNHLWKTYFGNLSRLLFMR